MAAVDGVGYMMLPSNEPPHTAIATISEEGNLEDLGQQQQDWSGK
jgi:hypothetical protein